MRKIVMLIVLNVLLIGLTAQGERQTMVSYQDNLYNFRFDYPKSWKLDISTKQKGYLALYDPAALKARDEYQTLDLLSGIKVEILTYPKENQEEIAQSLAGTTVCFSLTKDKNKIQLRCAETPDKKMVVTPAGEPLPIFTEVPYLLYIISHIKGESHQSLIIAYIVEKEKKEHYQQIYNQIVLSFVFAKRDP